MSNKNHGLYCYACMSQINAGDSVCPHCHASVPYCAQDARPHDLPCGAKLRDRFVVGRVIGRGGFGVLYLAYDEHMRTTRAIKEFFPKNAVRNRETLALEYDLLEIQTDMEKSRFLEEARLLTALQDMHIPNILRVFDEFEENNTSYILMEYVDGTNLDNYLQEKLNGKMPWREAVEVMQVLLDAVEQLHKNGIIHRDISLSNVMRRSDGRLCLIDFGSAWQMTSRADPYTSRKPAYSPREQWENGPQGVYSDIYALGVCLFKLIVGGLPKDGHGDGLPLLRSQATPETIPEWLETAVSTATQVDPKKRYASCAEFKQALRRAPRHSKNKVLLSACLLAVLAVGFAIGGVHLLTGGSGGVRQVQKALTAMGYLKANKPSGELDPETLLAMKAFGDEFGVAYTGEMNSEMESAILNAVQGNGKNLFGVDRDIQLTTYHASATADMNAPNKGVTFSTLSAINTENAGNAFLRIGNLDIREKGMYTFSADVRALDDVDVKLSLCGNEEGETVHITSKSTRISVSMNCTDIGNGASGYVDFFGTIDGQNILYLFNIKVEKGSTATDWSSPEPATPQVVTVTPSVSVQETDTPEPGDVTDSVTQQPSVNRNLFGFNKQITLSAPSGGSVYMNNGVNGLIFFTDENGADGTLLRIENPGMTEMGFYTFSADVEASCEAEISVSLCDAMPAQQFSVSNVKRRIEVTANCTQYVGDGTYTGFVSISGSIAPQCTLQFSNIKIEQGSTATEWSMAPEDDPNALPVDTPVPAESSVPADTSTPEPTPEPTATPVPEVHGDGVNLFGFLNGVESLSFADGVISSEQQLNGVSFTGGSNDSATTFLRISKLNMTEEGYYTFSANVRASQEVTVSFDMCDSEMLTFTATPAWQHISFSTYCTNYVSASEANGFADMYGLITEGN
ncbi:MAG: serine/threonine protein kinase, partial [Clostridia bacterium]|nr:serine/threonine protein kinase [Clostridia bacterium]